MDALRSSQGRGLFTDYYQLTMAQGYFELGMQNKVGTFDLFFRNNPFGGGYAVAAGIGPALDYVEQLRFDDVHLEYLKGRGIFSDAFLDYLRDFKFTGSIHGVPEGTVVFPHEPILQVEAPIIEAQLIETGLLNIINYSTLIATKTSRICMAARQSSVVDFGLRRAQGDGAYLGTRASIVGGASGTSFVDAARLLGVPAIGTHAHSWVQLFPSELDAFRAYAKVFPSRCMLLIDTYNVLRSGVPNAITVAKELKARGKDILGVRIDSGDLAYLAIETYRAFKKAGFPGIIIVLSNDLDEVLIESITKQIEAPLGSASAAEIKLRKEVIEHITYGVGTKLITGGEQAALGGVYKLVAVDGEPCIKVSENVTKIIDPGVKVVYRFSNKKSLSFAADVIALRDELEPAPGDTVYLPLEVSKKFAIDVGTTCEALLKPFITEGHLIAGKDDTGIENGKDRCKEQLARLHPASRRFLNPQVYNVGMSSHLFSLRQDLISRHRASFTNE
nr:nicotinate phosphoribosyltransferase [Candidatus Sigynarchaeum springense]